MSGPRGLCKTKQRFSITNPGSTQPNSNGFNCTTQTCGRTARLHPNPPASVRVPFDAPLEAAVPVVRALVLSHHWLLTFALLGAAFPHVLSLIDETRLLTKHLGPPFAPPPRFYICVRTGMIHRGHLKVKL